MVPFPRPLSFFNVLSMHLPVCARSESYLTVFHFLKTLSLHHSLFILFQMLQYLKLCISFHFSILKKKDYPLLLKNTASFFSVRPHTSGSCVSSKKNQQSGGGRRGWKGGISVQHKQLTSKLRCSSFISKTRSSAQRENTLLTFNLSLASFSVV